MATRGSYVHKPLVIILGGILAMLFLFVQFSQNIAWFNSDKAIHKAFEFIKLYKRNPFNRDFLYFHYLPKLYIAFKV